MHRVRSGCVEFERVDAYGNGAYETVVEFLVEGEVIGRGNEDELPFYVWEVSGFCITSLKIVWWCGPSSRGDIHSNVIRNL